MRSGPRDGVTRRRALQTGAVAAGLMWSAPAMRTVRVGQTNGSAPPTSTTTTTAPSRTITFRDAGFAEEVPSELHPRCGADSFRTRFRADFGDLGEAEVTVLACLALDIPIGAEISDGLVTVVLSGSTVNGTGSGAIAYERLPAPLPIFRSSTFIDIELTGGTGAFAGASGVATYRSMSEPDFSSLPPTTRTLSSIEGSITL